MDFDTPPQDFPKGWAKSARNIIWRGPDGDMRGENLKGTRLIPNLILPVGVNCCIGGVYDQVNSELYYCNYNSNGNHAIYIFNVKSEKIINLGVDSDVLDFDPANPIHSIDILYGDAITGNLLFWLSSTGICTRVNIKQAKAGNYGVYRQQYLNVIKRPPDIPMGAAYENTALTINNEHKQLFKFKYWFEYETYEQSVTSAQSIEPIPLTPFDTTVDADPTKNSGLALILQTGDPTVKKIHLACAYNTGTTFSDFFEIDLLVKADLSIPDDDIYLYRFYNDKAYINIDTSFSTLLYDSVPKQAGAQALMNGDTPNYGNYLQNFDPVNVNAIALPFAQNVQKTVPTAAMVTAQAGQAVGTTLGGNIHIIIAGIVRTGDFYEVRTTNANLTATASAGTVANALSQISAAATGAGFTIVSTGANDLTIKKNGENLLSSLTRPVNTALATTDVTPSSDWWSREAYAIEYFDPEGRTNGVFFTQGLTVQTLGYQEDGGGNPQIPYVNIFINNPPPVWAAYYHIVRTNDLSKLKFIQWITDRSFKDNIASADGNFYAYVSIESLNQYITDNPSSTFLAYAFAPGDRYGL